MTTSEKLETKGKIIQHARLLFAQHGFRGTSVRSIAEQSEVNIAAINYHFGSKENLYWAVVEEAFHWLDSGVAEIVASAKELDQAVESIFRFMVEGDHYVVSTMKSFLSDEVPPPEMDSSFVSTMENNCQNGPPGSKALGVFISKKFPKASPEAVEWFANSLLSAIFHHATMTCTTMFKNYKASHMPVERMVLKLQRIAKALCLFMNEEKNWK